MPIVAPQTTRKGASPAAGSINAEETFIPPMPGSPAHRFER